jgi:hypothetical protein
MKLENLVWNAVFDGIEAILEVSKCYPLYTSLQDINFLFRRTEL